MTEHRWLYTVDEQSVALYLRAGRIVLAEWSIAEESAFYSAPTLTAEQLT